MEKFKEAKKELDAKQKAFQTLINAMREKGEKLTLENKELKEAYDAQNKAREAAQKVALAAGKSDPKSKDGADALFFAAQGLMGTPDGEAVMDLLLEHHLDDVRIGQQIGGIDVRSADTGKPETARQKSNRRPRTRRCRHRQARAWHPASLKGRCHEG